jgi:NADH-ubiquinone oxidoreductase chain 2
MILTFLVLLLLSNGLTVRPDTSILYSRIGLTIIFYSLFSAYSTFYIEYLERGVSLYGGLFNATSITHTFQIFIFLMCGLILLMTAFYPRKKYIENSVSMLNILLRKTKEYKTIINKTSEQFTIIEYTLIIIFVISGATLLLASADLGSIYLCIELQSFSLYIISAIHRNSESSTGSALTYFLLGGLSSCFILLGIALIYANSGLTNLDSIYSIISDSDKYVYYSTWYVHSYIFYSLLLISVGFLFKIAAAPFHWWSPDVYDGVPTIVTTFIAILGKIAILILLLELVHYTSSLVYSTMQFYSWTTCLSLSCFFSLIIGTILGLTQTRIKRLLAYSTISHVGFIFYIFQYILTNFNAFLIIIAIGFSIYIYFTNISEYNNLPEKNNSPIQLISQLKGYFAINPGIALCLVITMFSFVGLPPLVGFFAKQMVLTAALDSNKTILVLTGVLTSVIGAVYYLTVIKTIYFDKSDYIRTETYAEFSLSNMFSITLAILNLIILMFILISDEILNLCNLLSIINFSIDGV